MATKTFHIGDVLSITDGKLMSPDGMGGVYDILNFMTRDNLFTHQLGRAADECKPYLLRQFPQLADINIKHINAENFEVELGKLVAQYGETFEVEQIPQDDHDIIDPIEEAERMMGKNKVIVVRPEDLEDDHD